MLSLNVHQRYFLFRGAVDMRKNFDGLSGLVRNSMSKDPLTGDVFVFINKRRNQVKLLCWERDGFAVYYKRLAKGCFELPQNIDAAITVEVLSCLLHGLSLQSIRKRSRYVRAA